MVKVTLVAKKGRHARPIRLPLRFHHTQFRFEEAKGSAHAPPRKNPGGRASPMAAGAGSGCGAGLDPLAGMD